MLLHLSNKSNKIVDRKHNWQCRPNVLRKMCFKKFHIENRENKKSTTSHHVEMNCLYF